MINFLKRIQKFALIVILVVGCVATASAQTPEQAGKPEASPKAQESSPPPREHTEAPKQKDSEEHLSPAEATELFKSVDEIIAFASKDTGLPIKNPVKRELASRETVEKYIAERMDDDEDEKRFERTELVLKKFGLLPRDFDLRPFMIKLLRDQVAGFYDSKRKTVHMLDWVPLDEQRPVLAHELTHALQDQTIDLEKWLKDLRKQVRATMDADNAEGEIDEEISARTALLEGQGMAVLIDYMLNPMGRSMENSPQFVEAMKAGMTSNEGSATLASAPMLLRESLIFPYRDGLGFVQALLVKGGKRRAYAGALTLPPHDTHEILSPTSYLDRARVPTMLLPNLKSAMGKEYERYDSGSVGQFDIVLLMKQFADNDAAREMSPEWRGGIYYAAKQTGAGSKEPPKTKDLALVYLSKWSTAAAAKKFAGIYERALKQKYANVVAKQGQWDTNEGLVSIETVGEQVLVMEGFDEKTAVALRKTMLNGASEQKGSRSVAQTNLSMRVASPVLGMRLLMGW